MSYDRAMEAAGAKVLEFKQFGSYQGDWWAFVEFNGQRGWVHAAYGSCSGCDAFEAEMGWDSHEHGFTYVSVTDIEEWGDTCSTCQSYKEKMRRFGADYLEGIMTQNEAEKMADQSANEEWADEESKEAAAFVRSKR